MLKNKKGIVFGIANDHSIAWGIAEKLAENGAELAITYQNNTFIKKSKTFSRIKLIVIYLLNVIFQKKIQ